MSEKITIRGLACSFHKEGSGSELILLHGWGQSKNFWQGFQTKLSKEYTTYAMDLPGFGISQEPSRAWNCEDYADYVHQLIQTWGVTKPTIIGHSFGGRVAAFYATKYPTEKVILYSASGVPGPYSFLKHIHTISIRALKHMIPNHIYRLHSRVYVPENYTNEVIVTTPRSKRMLDIYLTLRKEDLSEVYRKIAIPTLLLYGKDDFIIRPIVGRNIAHLIPHATFEIIHNATHFAHFENPIQFFKLLNKFLKY